ncbi:hypothetical protein E4U52_005391 [Claviceps spartinae]|nr:hypothetical protein E4U52_005391 [Claviceps spartinae]
MPPGSRPPPLPPRLASAGSSSQASASFLSPYSAPENFTLPSTDPRTSSTQSLVPSISEAESRRRLLVIYIHGFYGNDQSFQLFPAHVHACLKILLSSSHVIHSKIYPRYKTYKAIEIARDNFSAWLEPHESANTDVILVGHSMGGLLAAEVVLMSNRSSSRPQLLKHRILGIISMDAPLLGLHPGIVISGLASLFQPSPKVDSQQQSPETTQELESLYAVDSPSIDYLSSVDSASGSTYTEASTPSQSLRQPDDPYFDPPFHNDAPFREHSFLKRLINFTAKHKPEGLLTALGNHVNSHLEFGGCLADYRGLHIRYNRLRALEDVEDMNVWSNGYPASAHTRVRFVNYYTLSSGRPKLPKTEPARHEEPDASILAARCNTQGGREYSQESDGKAGGYLLALGSKAAHSGAGVNDEKACFDDVPADIVSLSIESHDNMDLPHVASTDEGQADTDTTLLGPTSTKNSQLPDPTPLGMTPMAMQVLEPQPLMDDDAKGHQSLPATPAMPATPATQDPPPILDLPAIPEPPEPPILPDPSQFSDKDAKKQAEREAKRLKKAYDQAIKDRNKAIQERERLLQKKCKKALRETEKKRQNEQKEKLRLEKETKMRVVAPVDRSGHDVSEVGQKMEMDKEREKTEEEKKKKEKVKAEKVKAEKVKAEKVKAEKVKAEKVKAEKVKAEKEKKLKRFVCLPSARNGVKDQTWLDVYMEDMDEVRAHCGLFALGPHYDKLVGDVGARVAGWVKDDLRKRSDHSGADHDQ